MASAARSVAIVIVVGLGLLAAYFWRPQTESSICVANQNQACPAPSWSANLASKAPYLPPELQILSNKDSKCELERSFFISRHCSRFPTSDSDLTKLQEALDGIPGLDAIHGWIAEYKLLLGDNTFGQCSSCGLSEQQGIGERFLQNVTDRPLKVIWSATSKQRAIDSALSWKTGLQSQGKEVSFEPNTPAVAWRCNDDPWAFSKLRFFETCKAYADYMETEADLLKKQWIDSTSRLSSSGASILQRMGLPKARTSQVPVNQLKEIALAVYGLCQTQVDIGLFSPGDGRWCTLLQTSDTSLFHQLGSRTFCFKSGPCIPEIGRLATCPLLLSFNDFLHADSELREASSPVKIEAYFAHAETLAPFLALLGLQTMHNFVPLSMSANLRIDILRCRTDGGNRFKALAWLNERPVAWPRNFGSRALSVAELRRRLELHLSDGDGCGPSAFSAFCNSTVCPA